MINLLWQAIRRLFKKTRVEPSIKLERVFNYCRKVTYTDEFGTVTAIVEDSSEFSKYGILICENEFDTDPERRAVMTIGNQTIIGKCSIPRSEYEMRQKCWQVNQPH